jgi:hypothetical protein
MCLARVFEGTGRAYIYTTAPVESPLPPANFALAVGSVVKNDCCVTTLTFLYASEVKGDFEWF